MTVRKLVAKRVPTVWGRRDLPAAFGGGRGDQVGEIWLEDEPGRDTDLMVKFLFTSQKLSVQVHPDDDAARRAGHRRGKDEAWLVLAAEPDAVIGLGLRVPTSQDALRYAAVHGSIEELMEWRKVHVGDVYYSPAGTLHAIGGGVILLEVQQNANITYRLYDYARPRELQVEAAIAVSRPGPCPEPSPGRRRAEGGEILAEGEAFVLERRIGPASGRLLAAAERAIWLVPLRGRTIVDGLSLRLGTAAVADAPVTLEIGLGAELILAYPGAEPLEPLLE